MPVCCSCWPVQHVTRPLPHYNWVLALADYQQPWVSARGSRYWRCFENWINGIISVFLYYFRHHFHQSLRPMSTKCFFISIFVMKYYTDSEYSEFNQQHHPACNKDSTNNKATGVFLFIYINKNPALVYNPALSVAKKCNKRGSISSPAFPQPCCSSDSSQQCTHA